MSAEDRFDEILRWVRIMAAGPLRDLLREHIQSETDLAVYQASDGARSRDQVGGLAGISGRAVGTRWAAWKEAGIVLENSTKKYPHRIASADSVGFELEP